MEELDGAVPHSRSPCRPVMIGDELNLDVPRSLYQLLDKDSGISESLEPLGASALESIGKFACRIDTANSLPAVAGCGLRWIATPTLEGRFAAGAGWRAAFLDCGGM